VELQRITRRVWGVSLRSSFPARAGIPFRRDDQSDTRSPNVIQNRQQRVVGGRSISIRHPVDESGNATKLPSMYQGVDDAFRHALCGHRPSAGDNRSRSTDLIATCTGNSQGSPKLAGRQVKRAFEWSLAQADSANCVRLRTFHVLSPTAATTNAETQLTS